ncbi:MAG: hypothetical protein GY765_19860 [bacterium]|nr:hypothetical protein [bacterium]
MFKNKWLVFMVTILAAFTWLTASPETIDIGVAWIGESGMQNKVSAEFEKELKKLAPQIKLEYKKELASLEALSEVVKQWEKKKKAVVLLRSNAAQWAGRNPPKIPTFIGGCNHPVQLGILKNLSAPEGNITGVTYYVSKETQFEVFREVLPCVDSLLLLLEKGHPSSALDEKSTSTLCKIKNIKLKVTYCSSCDDILQAVNAHKDGVTAVIIGSQALMLDSTEAVVNAAGKTPVLAFNKKPIKSGALCGLAADDAKLGRMLAQSVVDVVVKGKAIKAVGVKMDPAPRIYINTKSALTLGIKIPDEIKKRAVLIE